MTEDEYEKDQTKTDAHPPNVLAVSLGGLKLMRGKRGNVEIEDAQGGKAFIDHFDIPEVIVFLARSLRLAGVPAVQ